MAVVLAIPDLHAPWLHPDAVDFLADCKRKFRPDEVVCLGDEIDAHRWTDHPQSPECPGPSDELEAARKALRPIFKLFKNVKVCHSNHTRRILKRAASAALPASVLRSVGECLGSPPGWTWAHWWDIDGVHYRHGDGYTGQNGAINCAVKMRTSVVIGHIHSFAGVQYSQGIRDRVFGMNAGALVDPNAEVFSYGRYLASRPVIGAGVIRDRIPQFHPLGTGG